MPTIAAGQSQTVAVVQNTRLDLVGSGVVTFGPGPLNGQSQSIVNSGSVGPFDERDQVVYVSAGVAQISYSVLPTNTSAVVADQAANLYANGALVSGAGNPSRNRAIVVGDSRVDNCFGDVFTASKIRNINNRGWWAWLQGLSGNYWQLVQAAGVQADTIANVNARWASTIPGEMFGLGRGPNIGEQVGVAPFAPDWLFVELGINNIGAAQSLAAMTAEAEIFIANAEATGARIVWLNEGAVGASTAGYGTAYLNRLRRWNDWLKARAAASRSLLVVDAWAITVDPTSAAGNTRSGYLYDDAVHSGPVGARARAEAIWTAVQARWGIRKIESLPVSTADVYSAGSAPDIANRLADPLCLATPVSAVGATGNSGNAPTGYVPAACSNATCVYSVVPHPGGYGNCIQMDVTFTAAGGYAILRTARVEALFSGGETARFGVEAFVYGNAGAALTATDNLLTVKPQLFVVGSDAANYYSATLQETNTTEGKLVGNYNVQALTWTVPIPAGAPSRVQGETYIIGAGTGTVRVLLGRFGIFANGGPQG